MKKIEVYTGALLFVLGLSFGFGLLLGLYGGEVHGQSTMAETCLDIFSHIKIEELHFNINETEIIDWMNTTIMNEIYNISNWSKERKLIQNDI